MRNAWARARKVDTPYLTTEDPRLPHWQWRILKAYQSAAAAAVNPYARYYCAVRSPSTWGEWDYGDTYAADIAGDPITAQAAEEADK